MPGPVPGIRGPRNQYDLGKPSTCSAIYDSTMLVEIGATV
jgi:hypothetical protein